MSASAPRDTGPAAGDAASAAPADTPWRAGRFDTRGGPKRVLFGRVYEDPAIERQAFAPMQGEPVFCIASAGCTALALAQQHPVTAVDINPVQLDYAQSRLDGGPMLVGTAERLMGVGRAALVPFGWRRATLERFVAMTDPVDQVNFWRANLETRPVRFLMDLGLSISNLKLVYSSPLLACLPDRLGEVMRGRLRRTFAHHANATNPYARALLLGDLSPTPPRPPQPIVLACADAAGYLESQPPARFGGFSISNILDGAPPAYRARLFAAIRRAARPGARVVQRSFSEPAQFYGTATPHNCAEEDRSVLWGVVDVREVAQLPA
jgi:hypothetical protein